MPRNLTPQRPVVYCVNWSSPDYPHAAVQVLGRDGEIRDAYFPTWEKAMEFANCYAETARKP